MEIKKIFVAGAGLMGGGIAQVCAQAGYQVVMRDLSGEILKKGLDNNNWSVGKLVEKGKVQGTAEEIMGRIRGVTALSAAEDADFVFEAIVENLDAKREIFSELDKICPAHTIFATNTSAIPITRSSPFIISSLMWTGITRSCSLSRICLPGLPLSQTQGSCTLPR